MRLELAIHAVSDLRVGPETRLAGTRLQVNLEELRQNLLEDRRLESVNLEIVRPGDSCRVGYVFDILEPRAKEPGSGSDFPGILGAMALAGQGTTHVLRGAAVTVVDGGQPGGERGYTSRRGGVSKILEMSGPAAQASPYGSLQHLVVVPHAHPEVERHAVLNSLRVASVKAAVYLARAAIGHPPESTEVFDLEARSEEGLARPPRIAYIGQVHGQQHGTEADEHILYGSNTRGMLPVPLHPNEWLDGAVVISYSWGARGLETYFHQNHPVLLDLYQRHQAGEITLAGAIATASSDREEELNRNCLLAAQLARWNLKADGVIVAKYAGGAPHTDMFETARLCEGLGIKTVVLASDTAPDRRAESALLMNTPEVDAIVNHSEGLDVSWPVEPAQRIIAGNPQVEQALASLEVLSGDLVCGVVNNQGASRLQSMVY
ncbi:MAG: glycine/sarcosine/betaine reductase component B subunit [Dehalococcoidia bacterium]